MRKVIEIKAGKPMYAVMVDRQYRGETLNGRKFLVIYESHEEAGRVALRHPTAHVRQMRFMDFLAYCLRRGYGLAMMRDGELYTIQGISPDLFARALNAGNDKENEQQRKGDI